MLRILVCYTFILLYLVVFLSCLYKILLYAEKYFFYLKKINVRQSGGNLYLCSYLNKRILRDFTQELLLLFNISNNSEKFFSLYKFSFNNILYLHTKMNVKKSRFLLDSKYNELGYYLSGLIEADGSIILPKEGREVKILPLSRFLLI